MNQVSWALLPSSTLSEMALLNRSMKMPKSVLLKSRVALAFHLPSCPQDPELHHLMVTAAMSAFDIHNPNKPLVGAYEVQQNTSTV